MKMENKEIGSYDHPVWLYTTRSNPVLVGVMLRKPYYTGDNDTYILEDALKKVLTEDEFKDLKLRLRGINHCNHGIWDEDANKKIKL